MVPAMKRWLVTQYGIVGEVRWSKPFRWLWFAKFRAHVSLFGDDWGAAAVDDVTGKTKGLWIE